MAAVFSVLVLVSDAADWIVDCWHRGTSYVSSTCRCSASCSFHLCEEHNTVLFKCRGLHRVGVLLRERAGRA